MKNQLEIISKVEGGRLSLQARGVIRSALLAMSGKTVKVIVREQKRTRSLSQNAYYWSQCIPPIVSLFQEWGNNFDGEQVHEFLKDEVGKLSQVLVMPTGEVKKVSGSTANLKTMEFEEYLEKVRIWAAEWGVKIPLPNENKY